MQTVKSGSKILLTPHSGACGKEVAEPDREGMCVTGSPHRCWDRNSFLSLFRDIY